MKESLRLHELAVDEIARFDLLLGRLPTGVTRACWFATLTQAAAGVRSDFRTLVAAAADPLHDASLTPSLLELRGFASTEERRVRGGAPLSLARWVAVDPGLATYPHAAQLEELWREPPGRHAALFRALESAAWLDGVDPSRRAGELATAMLLCAAGRLAHLTLLPFADGDVAARGTATSRWREGAPDEWIELGLQFAARAARRGREAALAIDASIASEARVLDGLGRAGITATRAMMHLRTMLTATMPSLADDLGLSRPAAGDALERLVAAGLAVEVTGRARDRVFAWGAALTVTEARLAA